MSISGDYFESFTTMSVATRAWLISTGVLFLLVVSIEIAVLLRTNLSDLRGNELGDLIAGFFAPLTVIILVGALAIQARELKEQREEFMAQREALEKRLGLESSTAMPKWQCSADLDGDLVVFIAESLEAAPFWFSVSEVDPDGNVEPKEAWKETKDKQLFKKRGDVRKWKFKCPDGLWIQVLLEDRGQHPYTQWIRIVRELEGEKSYVNVARGAVDDDRPPETEWSRWSQRRKQNEAAFNISLENERTDPGIATVRIDLSRSTKDPWEIGLVDQKKEVWGPKRLTSGGYVRFGIPAAIEGSIRVDGKCVSGEERFWNCGYSRTRDSQGFFEGDLAVGKQDEDLESESAKSSITTTLQRSSSA